MHPAELRHFSTRYAGPAMVIRVAGDLDMLSAPPLAAHVRMMLRSNPPVVVIDLTNLRFLSAAGLEVLASAQREAACTTRVGVVAASPAVRRPIEITGIDQIVPVFRTLSTALASLTALTVSMD